MKLLIKYLELMKNQKYVRNSASWREDEKITEEISEDDSSIIIITV